MELHQLKDLKLIPPDPSRHWILPEVVPAGAVVDCFGPQGSGKTLFSCALAVATSTGAHLLGEPPSRVGPVIYVTSDVYNVKYMLNGMLEALGLNEPKDLLVAPMEHDNQQPIHGYVGELLSVVSNMPERPALIVDDGVLTNWKPHSDEDATKASRSLDTLPRQGVTVLVTHNPNDRSEIFWGQEARGLRCRYDTARRRLDVFSGIGAANLRVQVDRDYDATILEPIPALDISPAALTVWRAIRARKNTTSAQLLSRNDDGSLYKGSYNAVSMQSHEVGVAVAWLAENKLIDVYRDLLANDNKLSNARLRPRTEEKADEDNT